MGARLVLAKGAEMHSVNPSGATWRKSSRCAHGECIEVGALATSSIAVRDSKDHGAGPNLVFTPAEWRSFLTEIRAEQR
jgi:hypothetical protein